MTPDCSQRGGSGSIEKGKMARFPPAVRGMTSTESYHFILCHLRLQGSLGRVSFVPRCVSVLSHTQTTSCHTLFGPHLHGSDETLPNQAFRMASIPLMTALSSLEISLWRRTWNQLLEYVSASTSGIQSGCLPEDPTNMHIVGS